MVAPPVLQAPIAAVAAAYVALQFAFNGPRVLRRLTSRGDLSYGVYLFSWPVGQVVATLWGAAATPAVVIAISLPVTVVLALLSWHLVEKPALGLRKRFAGRDTETRLENRLEAAPAASAG